MGLTAADLVNKICYAGFICLGGALIPIPNDGITGNLCTPGNYCPSGTTTLLPCPAGSYEPRYGTSDAACQTCP